MAISPSKSQLTTSGVFAASTLPVFSSVSIESLKWRKPTVANLINLF